MKASKDITGAVKNIKFYASQIYDLAKKQMDEDVEQGLRVGINSGPGSIRFDTLGCIATATDWLDTYCDNILSNLKAADGQDKLLYKADYSEEGEQAEF